MNLKWLFWTGLLAIIVFFSAVYFGIKYDWINSQSEPKNTAEIKLSSEPEMKNSSSARTKILGRSESSGSGGLKPELIDEEVSTSEESKVLGSSELSIEEVVSQCQILSETIGVPQEKLEQSISECVDRNSGHLSAEGDPVDNQRATMIREQCNMAITQKELLSNEEIKLLVDECVASMSIN